MKIVIVIGTAGMGGAQRVAFTLAEWLNNKPDCHTTVVALGQAKDTSYDTSKHDFVELDGKSTVCELRTVIKAKRPDIVLTMTVPLCLYTVPALWGIKVKHVISERTAPSRMAAKLSTRFLSRLLMRTAEAYVFQTKGAQEYYGGRIAKHSAIIPNPLFDCAMMPATQYDGEDTKTIVTVGRLNEVKNHTMLIRAFKKVSEIYTNYKLIIYGEGPERLVDEELIHQLGLNDKVQLPGATNTVFDAIYNASIFVFTSNYEGMPNALMEAMALGLPCISTDCPSGGPKDLINDKNNGLLIQVGDEDALVKTMLYYIEQPNEAKAMGREAMKIRASHSMEVICKKWYDYFFHLVSNY